MYFVTILPLILISVLSRQYSEHRYMQGAKIRVRRCKGKRSEEVHTSETWAARRAEVLPQSLSELTQAQTCIFPQIANVSGHSPSPLGQDQKPTETPFLKTTDLK